MEILSLLLLIVGLIMAVIVFFRIIAAPVRLIFKLLINAVGGFLLLILANIICGFFNVLIPISIFSCVFCGIFGIPGVVVVVLITLFL